jgi:hypothetical protein
VRAGTRPVLPDGGDPFFLEIPDVYEPQAAA